jgi:hypothetical protein
MASTAEPPLPLGFTAITYHLRRGEVPPGSGPQYGAAPVKNSNQFPVEGRVECGGRRALSWAHSLSLSNWTAGAASIWGIFQTGGLYSGVTHHTSYSLQRPGSFNLDLIGLSLLVKN